MRIDPHQKWHPVYLLQPLYNLVLMGFFEWGVAFHDMNPDAIRAGEKPKAQALAELKAIGLKARRQIVKDYLAFPALSAAAAPAGRRARTFKSTYWADFTANIVRNVWAHSIIFCGHFPDQTYTFSEGEVAEETRGGVVRASAARARPTSTAVRCSTCSAATSPSRSSTTCSPTCPRAATPRSRRACRDICRRYGLPYNTGPLHRQLGAVHRTILRLAFPGGSPRPKRAPVAGG